MDFEIGDFYVKTHRFLSYSGEIYLVTMNC